MNPIHFELPTTVAPNQEEQQLEIDPLVSSCSTTEKCGYEDLNVEGHKVHPATLSMGSVAQQALKSEEHERNLTVGEYNSEIVASPVIPSSAYEQIENVDSNSEDTSTMRNEEDFVNLTDNSIHGNAVTKFDPFFPEMHIVVLPGGEVCTRDHAVHVPPPPEISQVVHDCQRYIPTNFMSTCYQQEDDTSKEMKLISEDTEPSQRSFGTQSPSSHIVVPTGSLATQPTAEHSDDKISFTIEPAASANSCAYGSTHCQESCKWTPQSVLANFEVCHPQQLGHHSQCDPPSQYHKHPAVER